MYSSDEPSLLKNDIPRLEGIVFCTLNMNFKTEKSIHRTTITSSSDNGNLVYCKSEQVWSTDDKGINYNIVIVVNTTDAILSPCNFIGNMLIRLNIQANTKAFKYNLLFASGGYLISGFFNESFNYYVQFGNDENQIHGPFKTDSKPTLIIGEGLGCGFLNSKCYVYNWLVPTCQSTVQPILDYAKKN